MRCFATVPFLLCALTAGLCRAEGEAIEASPTKGPLHSPIPDEWTASVVRPGSVVIGSLAEVGVWDGLMVGTDPSALLLGAKTAQVKCQIPSFGEDDWAVGLKYISMSRKSLWWGDTSQRFSKLEAKIVRPSISWSNRISQRLIIHSFWASGFGSSSAELSPYGKEKLQAAKHGTGKSGDGHSFANRTMQMQSIAGFTEDRFQLTAEWERSSGDRILLSSRIERTRLDKLETFSMRATLAQQWAGDGFNLRIGAGPQYAMFSGQDLDGEEIKTAGWLPAADFAIYWIL
jgi:hypothetical protein